MNECRYPLHSTADIAFALQVMVCSGQMSVIGNHMNCGCLPHAGSRNCLFQLRPDQVLRLVHAGTLFSDNILIYSVMELERG